MKKPVMVDIISALLVLLFVYAAVSKLLDYDTFKFQLGRSPYVTNMAGLVAWALPVGEIVVALLLILKRTRLLGLYASFFLMLLFTGYIYAILNFSYSVPCSCGGVLSKMNWRDHLAFNIVFTIISLVAIILESGIISGNQEKLKTIAQ